MGLKLYKPWTPEEDEKFREILNNSSISYFDIGRQMNRSTNACQGRAKLLGLSNNFINRTYYYDNFFWGKPNPINCYWAGIIASDGSLNKPSSSLKLEISKKDESILRQFIIDASYTGLIHNTRKINKSGTISNMINVSINGCRDWFESLKKNFNIVPNKVKRLAPPNLLDNYLKLCYLIGYTDGDGTICLDKRNNLQIRYCSASFYIIKWIREIIETNFTLKLRNRQTKVCNSKNGNYFSFGVNGIRSFIVFDCLHRFPVPKLARKWRQPKVLEFLEEKKQQYPEFFSQVLEVPPEWKDFDYKTYYPSENTTISTNNNLTNI